jgi:heterodisulfide reductase subunit A
VGTVGILTINDNSKQMIKADDLFKKYGDLIAVDGVSFEVQSGETLGLLGPNGAGKTKIEAVTSQIDSEKCNYCGLCSRVCPHNAIMPADKKARKLPVIIQAACAGCGACAAECQQDAIIMRHFRDKQIMAQIEAILAVEPHKQLVTFACNWCSYAGGDNAGTARLQYPTTCRLIRTMCSGRVDKKFILHTFRIGAPMVLVSGCHFTDCHYINAVQWTLKRMDRVWTKLDKLGIRPERLQLEWIPAAEGQKFVKVMRKLEEMLKTVTIDEIKQTMKALEKALEDEKKVHSAQEVEA